MSRTLPAVLANETSFRSLPTAVKVGALSPALSSGPTKVNGLPFNVVPAGLSCGISQFSFSCSIGSDLAVSTQYSPTPSSSPPYALRKGEKPYSVLSTEHWFMILHTATSTSQPLWRQPMSWYHPARALLQCLATNGA